VETIAAATTSAQQPPPRILSPQHNLPLEPPVRTPYYGLHAVLQERHPTPRTPITPYHNPLHSVYDAPYHNPLHSVYDESSVVRIQCTLYNPSHTYSGSNVHCTLHRTHTNPGNYTHISHTTSIHPTGHPSAFTRLGHTGNYSTHNILIRLSQILWADRHHAVRVNPL
jgi:hypothetical protein